MRKLQRQIAKYKMRCAGINKPNKRYVSINPRTGLKEVTPSFFSQHWREYV